MAELLEDHSIEPFELPWDTSGGTLVSEIPTLRESADITPAPITHVQSIAESEAEQEEIAWAPLVKEAIQEGIIESPKTLSIEQTRQVQELRDATSAFPPAAELEAERGAEQAEQEEFAGIFAEQQQTISSLDSILREKAAEPTTTGTLYMQPPPAGTGTNYALFIGAGLGLWLLMK